jgi:Arc/MetJ family transcription regulator
MASLTRKRNRGTWQKLLQPIKLNARKRADCVLREARCATKRGAVRAALEQAVAIEIERMRALHESEDTIETFRAATEVHIALCEREASEHESSARAGKQSTALQGDDIAPA